MKFLPKFPLRAVGLAFCLTVAIFLAACNRGRGRVLEVAYVAAVQANLRDQVSAVYEKAGVVKNGDRVEVLDHDRRFVKVRTATGATGWLEQRYLVGQDVYDRIQKLTADNQKYPIQAQGAPRNDTNLHVEPGRDTEHLYQISSGEKLSLLKRATAEKPGSVAPTPRGTAATNATKETNATKDRKGPAAATPVKEDWWLVRDSHNRFGWVLARMIDLDIPLDIAQYAEGQRIIAFFVLNQVQDGDKKVSQYLTLVSEPRDGLPYDFDQVRVFTWNVKRHRYETAYRERVHGELPVKVSQESFDKEGVLPVFILRTKDDEGKVVERKYKLNTPIVRRVLAPGEQPPHATPRRSKRSR